MSNETDAEKNIIFDTQAALPDTQTALSSSKHRLQPMRNWNCSFMLSDDVKWRALHIKTRVFLLPLRNAREREDEKIQSSIEPPETALTNIVGGR
jgi:hypothetical protein